MTSPPIDSDLAAGAGRRHPPAGIGWRHPHYAALLESLPPLDFIEVHSENFFGAGGAARAVLRQARQHYAVSLHGVGLALGSAAGVDPWHLDQLALLVSEIEPARVSDHACFARAGLNAAPGRSAMPAHAADLLPIPFNAAALDVICDNVQRVQDRLKRQVLVENLSAYVRFSHSDRPETSFLCEMVRRTGCGLLVDVNNLYVNALNDALAGSAADPLLACMEWLDAITPGAAGELHLAGHLHCGDIVIDDHGSKVCDDVWQLYGHAQQRFGGVPALVEWDTGVPPLEVLLAEASRACQPQALAGVLA